MCVHKRGPGAVPARPCLLPVCCTIPCRIVSEQTAMLSDAAAWVLSRLVPCHGVVEPGKLHNREQETCSLKRGGRGNDARHWHVLKGTSLAG